MTAVTPWRRIVSRSRCLLMDVAHDEVTPANGTAMPGREVVVDHHSPPGPDQGLGDVAADVAGATRDQDGAVISVQWSSR